MDPKNLILVNMHYAVVDSENNLYYINTSKQACEEQLTRYQSLENGDYRFKVIELDTHINARVVGVVADEEDRSTEFIHQRYDGALPVEVVLRSDRTGRPVKTFRLWANPYAVKLAASGGCPRERFMTSDDYVVVLDYSTMTAECWKAGERSTTCKLVGFKWMTV